MQNKKTKEAKTKSVDRSDIGKLSGKAISLFFMVNSMKELLETPQSIMPTQAIAKRYVELRDILKEIQPESTNMIPVIETEKVKIEELKIGFQMMYAVCIPFILDYSQQFKELLDMVRTFLPSNPQSQDFLSAHRDLIFALGLGEEWASAALFLSLLEIMFNEKLVQLGSVQRWRLSLHLLLSSGLFSFPDRDAYHWMGNIGIYCCLCGSGAW